MEDLIPPLELVQQWYDEARDAIREVALWLNEAPLDLYPHDRVTIVNTIYDQANQ